MKRNLTLDILKIILSFMIVGLHAGFLIETSKLGNYVFMQGISRIAVPIFFHSTRQKVKRPVQTEKKS